MRRRLFVLGLLCCLALPVRADQNNGNPFDSDLQLYAYQPWVKVQGTKVSVPLLTLPKGKLYVQFQLFGPVLEFNQSTLPNDPQSVRSMVLDDLGKFRTAQYWLMWKYSF